MRKAKNKAEAEIILSVNELKNELFKKVKRLKCEYTVMYGYPNYVKIPQWIYKSLLNFYEDKPTTLLGLIICPTISINTIDEIEVF